MASIHTSNVTKNIKIDGIFISITFRELYFSFIESNEISSYIYIFACVSFYFYNKCPSGP